jgi:hypothetical protein
MSGSMAPDPPVRAARPSHYLRFVLIIAIGFLWIFPPHGVPGEPIPPEEDEAAAAKERYCIHGHPADILLEDGTYICEFGHEAWESDE